MMWCVQQGRMIFLVVLKARQMGISCFGAGWHFWHLWRGRDVRTLDVTHDKALAGRIIDFYRVFYDSLPVVKNASGEEERLLRPPLRDQSSKARIPKSELFFSDRMCQGDTYVASNLDSRGFTTQHCAFREPAFYGTDVLNDIFQTIEPQLPALGTKARLNCSIMMESTPNGQNNFYDFWEAGKEEDSEYVCVFLPWYIHDDEYALTPPKDWRMTSSEKDLQIELSHMRRKIDGQDVTRAQMYWRHCKLINLKHDEDSFDMEYASDDQTCFLQRSESVFSEDMKFLTSSVTQAELRAKEEWARLNDTRGNPIETNGPVTGSLRFKPLHSPFETVFHRKVERPRFVLGNGDLCVWEPPRKGHIYFGGADVAGGELGRDLSTCCVVDLVTGRQVAEYGGHIQPELFADILVHLCEWYNHMMIMPELNGLGSVVIKRMSGEWGFTNFAHEEKWDELGVKKNKPGWWTSPQNRPMIFSTLKWFIQEKYIQFASRPLVRELSTFRKEGMEYRTAKAHQHDDFVVAAGLCCIGIKQAPKYLAMVDSARSQRIPTAVDLGLSHQPDFAMPSSSNAKLKETLGEDHFEKMFGSGFGSMDQPFNVLRGPYDMMDY